MIALTTTGRCNDRSVWVTRALAAASLSEALWNRAVSYAGVMDSREATWDKRILERMRPSVDATLVTESLRLTPTQRLARLQRMMAFMEQVRTPDSDALPRPSRRA